MGTDRLAVAKPLRALCGVMVSALFFCALLGASGTTAAMHQEPNPPARFHEPTLAENQRASQFLADAIDLHVTNPTRARELLHQSMGVYEQSWGPYHPETGGRHLVSAYFLWREGWLDGAEEAGRRAFAIAERHFGPAHPETASRLSFLAILAERNDQPLQAETMYRAALRITMRDDPGGEEVGNTAYRLAEVLAAQGRFEEAQPFFDQSLAVRERLGGPSTSIAALALRGVGGNQFARGRFPEALATLSRAARIPRNQSDAAPRTFPEIMTLLGRTRDSLGDSRGADAAFAEAVELTLAAWTGQRWYSSDAEVAYGRFKRRQRQPAEAARLLRAACQFDRDLALISLANQRGLTECMKESVLALREWASAGGGREADNPAALRAEAFGKAQYAELFESGYSLARYGARVEAAARGAGPAAQAYHAAEQQYRYNRALFADSFSDPNGSSRRPELVAAIERSYAEMLRHRNQIRLNNPIYWSLQQPESLEVAALQARRGPNSRLLNEDEALVVFMIPEGGNRGVVFAITKTGFEWAETAFTGAQIAQRVTSLRAQIDPGGYGSSRSAAGQPFDRQAAHELYAGLFGDPNIRSVLAGKRNWLVVPSGPLASLPLGVLVTERPLGGATSDSDPAALRATRWLLRERTITVLPAVASLRTLRQVLPPRQIHSNAEDRLVAFADADFAGAAYGYPPPPPMAGTAPTERGRPRAVQGYYRGDQALVSALRTLERLEGTGREAEAVRIGLGAPRSSVHLRNNASETRLRTLQAAGQLERAQVILFASHGLVAGDLGLAQPALALATPAPGVDPALDDGLLTAAEAASLTLNADWVILSACNTAAPGSPGAQGLSGLIRGFFNAGARSLLVSHWRVRDDVAAILVPDTLARLGDGRATNKADALRQASLAILDDNSRPDFAFPFAWAPFMLVGETAG